jgi:hypothetical protein
VRFLLSVLWIFAAVDLTPSERSLRARLAAHAMHSQHDTMKVSAAGRAAFMARFIDEVDPDRTLPEAERLRRAEHAKSAYFARLQLESAKARRRKKARRKKAS